MKHCMVALTNGDVLGKNSIITSYRGDRSPDGWTTLFDANEAILYTIPNRNILWIHLTDTPMEKTDPVRPLNTIGDWPVICEFANKEPAGFGTLKWEDKEYKVYMGDIEAHKLCVGVGPEYIMKHKFTLIEV